MNTNHVGSNATMTIGGVDMQVRFCAAQTPWSGFDPAEPGSDRTAFCPPLPASVTFKMTEEVAGDFKRFIDSAFDECAKDAAFDPWADTHRLNDLGRAPNRQRDIAEFECRFVMRGTPLVVTKAQAKVLEALEFDQALYTATDTPFSTPLREKAPEPHGGGHGGGPRDRWGRMKR